MTVLVNGGGPADEADRLRRLIMREVFAPMLRRQFGAGTILPVPETLHRRTWAMEIIKRVAPPKGLRRRLWRIPIGLYRVGLGPLMGHRFMLLTHTGRVSGQPRHVVIEVVQSDEHGYVVASGFGRRSDWYRNVIANPQVAIQIGGRRIDATASPIDADEGAAIMARYASRHPRAARVLCKVMGFAVNGTAEDFLEVGRRIPFVRVAPRT